MAAPTDDYSKRLEEVLAGDEVAGSAGDEDSDEEFIYTGVDAPPDIRNYAQRMKAVMGTDDSEQEVEGLLQDEDEDFSYLRSSMDEVLPDSSFTVLAANTSWDDVPRSSTPDVPASPIDPPTHSKMRPAFLHPSVSRLRSFQPEHRPRMGSMSSMHSMNTLASVPNGTSSALSHFSDVSRASTPSRLDEKSDEKASLSTFDVPAPREPFRWNSMRTITAQVYTSTSKSSAVLGLDGGSPTTLTAKGMVCVGLENGCTAVFDFRQQLKCVCGNDATGKQAGPVTALSLSYDHTFLAVGHSKGYIFLYDLARHHVPARTVSPTTMSAVVSGQREGHLSGSPVTHLSFIGARHTALVSADQSGLAFYHSLGKVLFMEASDVLRIIGRYPDEQRVTAEFGAVDTPTAVSAQRDRSTILSMMALPLGPASHPAEAYNLIAILTPLKLIIVGLRPSPRTWFRHHREIDSSESRDTFLSGCLAWFPSFADSSETKGRTVQERPMATSRPVLAYSWGSTVGLLRVDEIRPRPLDAAGRPSKRVPEVGKVTFEQEGKWTAEGNILSIHWLNERQLLVFTKGFIDVLDIRTMKSVEQAHVSSDYRAPVHSKSDESTARSPTAMYCVSVYKEKIFLLGSSTLRVGSLTTWSDHILAFMQEGNFLGAIDLCRTYYTGEAVGNKSGLPDDSAALRELVGEKMSELMIASARYAFAEERMYETAPDASSGRGVDRTELFEKLVVTCGDACLALGNCDFLFYDLYERYQDSGIDGIYLAQLEPFVLDGRIKSLPPHISQRLIAIHEERGEYEEAEALIWHMDPLSLGIDQAIQLCKSRQLYDALIYVYTSCLQDFVTPLVDLLQLIQEINRRESGIQSPSELLVQQPTETLVKHAYKVYPYLSDTLCGIEYPSNGKLDDDDAAAAKKAIYGFLFFGRTPIGRGHSLTNGDIDGVDSTYPYLRLLLRFDAEAFLHTLDLAFEDSYLNDEDQDVSRQLIINVLLDISQSLEPNSTDATFLRIFIARNAPKYIQFVQVTPSTYDRLLLELANNGEPSTREDRQLAAEYLLSVYMPHDGDRFVEVFEKAGFYRILRSIYTQERRWPALLSTFLRDQDMEREELFSSIDAVLTRASRLAKGTLPEELRLMIVDSLPRLIDSSIYETANLIDTHLPAFHSVVLETLSSHSQQQFVYLRYLLEPGLLDRDAEDGRGIPRKRRLQHVDPEARRMYISLLCVYDPTGISHAVSHLPPGFFDMEDVVAICDNASLFDVEIWCMDHEGQTSRAFDKMELVLAREADALAERFTLDASVRDRDEELQRLVSRLEAVTNMALQICQTRVHQHVDPTLGIEEMWFRLLYSEVNIVQKISSAIPTSERSEAVPRQERTPSQALLDILRDTVQKTLLALMATPSSRAPTLSFPALFARLANTISASHHDTTYSEFRTILTGMLGHYRGEADSLAIVTRLVGQDLFTAVEELTAQRKRGWRARPDTCGLCGRPVAYSETTKSTPGFGSYVGQSHMNGSANGVANVGQRKEDDDDLIVTFAGQLYHRKCFGSLSADILH